MTLKRIVSSLACLAAVSALTGSDLLNAQEPATDHQPRGSAQLTLDDLRTFADVFNQVRRNYVESVDDKTLLDSAIRGMLTDLDPHSEYLAQTDYQDLDDASRGRYSGIGVSVDVENFRIVVRAILGDSPADRAGINPGDIITSIDGRAVKGRYLPDAMDELDGEPGTRVTLMLQPPDGEAREVSMEREYLSLPTLSYELLDRDYGYFRITQFHRDSATDLEQTLASIREGGTQLRGLIIDLRDNPGGVLQPAVAIADGFLDDGLIVSTRGRNASMQMSFEAQPGQWLPGTPLVLMVDRGSASASEVLAGALQDHRRALILGERTFGKGSVQSVLPLRNGSGIKLTTARYFTPNGRSIQAAGILPDVEIREGTYAVEGDLRIREAELEGHLVADRTDAPTGAAGPKDFPMEEVMGVLEQSGLLRGAEHPRPAAQGGESR